MARSTYWSPGNQAVSMGAADPALYVACQLWATGDGPADEVDTPETLTLTDGVNLQVTGYVGAIEATVTPASPTAALAFGYRWGPYDGLIGQDPEAAGGFSLRLAAIDPTGAPPSGVVTFAGVTITVSGLTNGTVVHDTFHDTADQQLVDHTPDEAPDGTPTSDLNGWNGKAAYGDVTEGTYLTSGGNEGTVMYGRVFAALHDLQHIWCDVLRNNNPGGPGELWAIAARMNKLAGNTDTNLDVVVFYCQRYDDNQVWVSWEVHAGGATVQQRYQFGLQPWAYGVTRRMEIVLAGNKVWFYFADAGTGANRVLVDAGTLTPSDLNDASHEYVGFANAHYTDSVRFYEFFSGPMAAVSQSPSVVAESIGLVEAEA